jgi:hypothetical protein
MDQTAHPAPDPQLAGDAASWRYLQGSPHVAHILAEYIEWERRRTARETSNTVATAIGHRFDTIPTYAELTRRRTTYTTPAMTPAQIRATTARSWAAFERDTRVPTPMCGGTDATLTPEVRQ